MRTRTGGSAWLWDNRLAWGLGCSGHILGLGLRVELLQLLSELVIREDNEQSSDLKKNFELSTKDTGYSKIELVAGEQLAKF